VHINQGCFLDARGGLIFEDNVSVSHYSKFVTGGHDWNDPEFKGIFSPIKVKEYVWVGIQCVILQGVTLGQGSVIASCSLVNTDTESYALYAGLPAKKLKNRNTNQEYHPLEGVNHFRFM
ncbi:MAG: acyltransferase, partial [Bacilli bacterium]|nr:acyltransferase [Bacilli bacterium]